MESITQRLKNVDIKNTNVKVSTKKYPNGYRQIVRTNESGKLDGDQELYDDKNRLKSFDQYIDNIRNGFSRKYDNGVLISENIYINNKLNGTCREWDKEGNLVVSIDYSDGKFHGDHIVFIEPFNQIRYVQYRNGKKHGYEVAVEDDVNVMEMTYKNDVPYGKRIKRHSNGQLLSEVNYVNGEENGDVIEYDENGKIESKMKIVDGRYVGPIKRYN